MERVRTIPSKPNTRLALWIGVLAAVALATTIFVVVVSQSSGTGHYSVVDNKVTIETATIGQLGTVLVTDQGYALYTFPPDAQQSVTCYERCALKWPPIVLADGVRVVAGAGVEPSLLSEVTDRDGKRVATYNGWPLYLFEGDVTPGPARGHGQYLNGGYWYVISPSGDVIMPSPNK